MNANQSEPDNEPNSKEVFESETRFPQVIFRHASKTEICVTTPQNEATQIPMNLF